MLQPKNLTPSYPSEGCACYLLTVISHIQTSDVTFKFQDKAHLLTTLHQLVPANLAHSYHIYQDKGVSPLSEKLGRYTAYKLCNIAPILDKLCVEYKAKEKEKAEKAKAENRETRENRSTL